MKLALIGDLHGDFSKLQVTRTLHKDNQDRECLPFTLADQHLGSNNNLLLTLDEESATIEYNQCKIQKINLIQWLLDLT